MDGCFSGMNWPQLSIVFFAVKHSEKMVYRWVKAAFNKKFTACLNFTSLFLFVNDNLGLNCFYNTNRT